VPDRIHFHGRGLHGGARCALALRRRSGPVAFELGSREALIAELEVVRADRGVRVRAARLDQEIELVEHLLAAFAGLGIRQGIACSVSGGEIPLLDGASLELARALLALEPPRASAELRVVRDGEIRAGDSLYRFFRRDALELAVEVDFRRAGLGVERAAWSGSAEQFLREIAPARTFGFRRDAEELRRSGRARWVDPEVVLVFDDGGRVLAPARPPEPGELARHKLLDLLGDLYLHGGPPIGRLEAIRPGHAATHRALAEARARGLVR
jgi:UDP-3-O-[3-hydroxymyristoyl] N-acetylglucosamine deacetylase